MKKLNIGCGKRNFGDEWLHIDGGDFTHLDHNNIFDFPYEELDLIYASHLIEYFDRQEVLPLLKYWKTKLKPGGILRIAVPNFVAWCDLYKETNDISLVLGPLYGKWPMKNKIIYHKTAYDESSLSEVLSLAGFSNVRFWDWREVDHGKFDDHSQSYYPHMDKTEGRLMSLNMEAENVV